MKREVIAHLKDCKWLCMVLLVMAIAVTVLLVCSSCTDTSDSEEIVSGTQEAEEVDGITDSVGAVEEGLQEQPLNFASEQTEESEVNADSQAGTTIALSTQSSSEAQGTSSSGGSDEVSMPQKHWIEDTQQVWVVDSASWSEQTPIYETRELSICNVCGADITANTTSHTKAHMLAGEGGGYHSEVKQVQVGIETINHPEEGHWETKVVGGHWE